MKVESGSERAMKRCLSMRDQMIYERNTMFLALATVSDTAKHWEELFNQLYLCISVKFQIENAHCIYCTVHTVYWYRPQYFLLDTSITLRTRLGL